MTEQQALAAWASNPSPGGLGAAYFNTTSQVLMLCDGVAWVPASQPPQAKFATATALGLTATDITGLTATIVSGGVYYARCRLILLPVGAPTDTKVTITGPTSSAANWRLSILNVSGSVLDESFGTTQLPHADSATTASTATWVEYESTFTASSATALKVQGTRVGGTSQTVQPGSVLYVERVG